MIDDSLLEDLTPNVLDQISTLNDEFLTSIGQAAQQAIENPSMSEAEKYAIVGAAVAKLESISKEITPLISKEIESAYTAIAKNCWENAEYMSKYTNIPYTEFTTDSTINKLMLQQAQQTFESVQNLSNTTMLGTYISDGSGGRIWVTTREAYINVIDNAIQSVTATNGESLASALKNALNEIGGSGLQKAYYNNEGKRAYSQNIVSAARRNILDGMNQAAQQAEDEVGEKFGADGKELSAHVSCAEDHIDIQGKQYTNEDYEIMNSELTRHINTCNCGHTARSIIMGVDEPVYNDEELAALNKRNTDGWTDENNVLNKRDYDAENPKKYTLYQADQELRKLENSTRKAYSNQKVYEGLGDTDMIRKYSSSAKSYRATHTSILKALEPYGFRADPSRFII